MKFLLVFFNLFLTSLVSLQAGAVDDLVRIKQHVYNTVNADGQNVEPAKDYTWVFYGDSVTHGLFHTSGARSYPEIFHERVRGELGCADDVVINSGKSGCTTVDLLIPERFNNLVMRFKPDVVFFMIGLNDARSLNRIDVATYKKNMAAFIDAVRKDGGIPILQTCNAIELYAAPAGTVIDDYHMRCIDAYRVLPLYMEALRDLAAEKDVILIDHFRYWNENAVPDPKILHAWLAETIHPGPLGHLKFAETIFKSLKIDTPKAPCLSPTAIKGIPTE